MSTLVQAATTTYASRVKTGNTPLIIPSPALLARNKSLVTGTPLAAPPTLQSRPSFRSNSRLNGDDDDDDDDDEFLEIESDDGKKDKEEEEGEESSGFVLGPPPDTLIQRRNAAPTKHLYRSDMVMENAALAEEVMIPIRLDMDLEQFKIKDAFMWNMNEELVTPDQFANIMCLDLDIPPQVYAPQISTAIRTQIEEYAPVAEIQIPEETEMRIIVNIQLHLGKHLLRDQFEWNLSSTSDLTPEAFALLVCQDLSLSSDFPPTLAHAIHESLLRSKKDALEGNLPMFINEAAYGLDAGIRLDTESLCSRWSPTLEILTRDEIERREGDRERQIRRLKRDTARFGGLGSFAVVEEEILSSGRRRLKRKRSTSPTGRATPRGAASRSDSPAVVDISVARAASLTDNERARWRCGNCLVPGTGTFAVRKGPDGPRQLCNNCGVWYAKTGEVPEWRRRMYAIG